MSGDYIPDDWSEQETRDFFERRDERFSRRAATRRKVEVGSVVEQAIALFPDRDERHGQIVQFDPTPGKVDLIRRTIAPDVTADEFEMFLAYCRRTNLDPIARQIYIIVRGRDDKRKATIQTSIDGFRLIAQRTGRYRGRVGPFWCGPDGNWVDVWLSDDPPAAAKVGVRLADSDEITWAVCRWKDFVQTDAGGVPTKMWKQMGPHMLGKCCESQALRTALPGELSGLYTDDELAQADNPRAINTERRPNVSDLRHTTAAKAPANGGAVRPKDRAQAEEWYLAVKAECDREGVPARELEPGWTDRDLLLEWAARVKDLKTVKTQPPPAAEPSTVFGGVDE